MAMQMRRGQLKDFQPTKLLPGEWAVSIDAATDNQIVWMCFAPGVTKRMGTYEDFKQQIAEASAEILNEYRAQLNMILSEVQRLAQQARDDKDSVVIIKTCIENFYLPQIEEFFNNAKIQAQNAAASATAAAASQAASKASEVATKNSEISAAQSASDAAEAAAASQASKLAAADSEAAAKRSQEAAAASEQNTAASETAAKESQEAAKESETNAATSEENAAESKQVASEKAKEASDNADLSKSYAVGGTGTRDGEDTDNSKYYSEQSGEYLNKVETAGGNALDAIDNALKAAKPEFVTSVENGHLYYKGGRFVFRVDDNGHLKWRLMI